MRNLSFQHLISHTFPGFILFFELIGLLFCFVPNVDEFVNSLSRLHIISDIIIVSGFFIVSTILGLIIDCINHRFFEWKYPKISLYEIHKEIETKEQLDIFRYLIDEQIFYYYECYINIGISLFPGLFIIPYVLQKFFKLNCLGLVISSVVILGIIIVLFWEGKITYDQVYKHEEEFIENIRKRRQERINL